MDIQIHCPVHDKDETLDLKDGYWYFTGEVQCGNSETTSALPGPRPIKIEIEKGTIMSIEPAGV